MRKYKLNENYFEKIDSKDKAYFLGLLFADGCNAISRTQKHCSVIISLQEQDKEILQKFMNIVSPNKPLQLINNDCEDLYIKRKKEKFEEIFCAFDEKSSNETGLIAGTPEMAISSQASIEEGSSTIPEMEVESSDSKCPALSK